ncbi:MAG: DEAD/DEAH box helicase [Thermoleophilaceae bacterium]
MSQSFARLGVGNAVAGALSARGFTEAFPVQERVIPDALAGHDLLCKSPTGSGKSLAFGIPLAERLDAGDRRPAALILVPTRELAGQIVDELQTVANARALSIAAVYGGVGIAKQARRAAQAHILVATPGRLEDLLQRRALTLAHVRMLILDEADRMLDMGFKPAVDRIVAATADKRQTMLFSATLDRRVEQLASAYTHDPRRHEQAAAPDSHADVKHRFVAVETTGKLEALVAELRGAGRGRTLVFVRTKHGADRLVKRLGKVDLRAAAMHGNKTQNQRQKALARFTSGEADTLVATDVAARGLDVDDITHVINYDAPPDREDYVHRVGRTGRAGRTGIGITFVTAEQAHDVGKIARELSLQSEFSQVAGGRGRR